MFETITIETDARGVATLTLNRPEKHNAMSGKMLEELTSAALQLGQDDSVRVVILTGEGKSFCAGGDLGWMRAQRDMDPETRGKEARKLAEMLQALNTLPKPLIGRVQGNAFGGGVGMASVCDVAVGADHLTMAYSCNHRPICLVTHGRGHGAACLYVGASVQGPRGCDLGTVGKNRTEQ